MERSVGRSDRPVSGSRAERLPRVDGWSAASDEKGLPLSLLLLLAGEIGAFVALAASGNMPGIVTVLYRALLTL